MAEREYQHEKYNGLDSEGWLVSLLCGIAAGAALSLYAFLFIISVNIIKLLLLAATAGVVILLIKTSFVRRLIVKGISAFLSFPAFTALLTLAVRKYGTLELNSGDGFGFVFIAVPLCILVLAAAVTSSGVRIYREGK